MKYFAISFIHICLLRVVFILPWDKASSPVLEGEACPKGSVTQGLGRYITPVISQAEVRRGSWSEEEMLLLDLLMMPLGAPSDVP